MHKDNVGSAGTKCRQRWSDELGDKGNWDDKGAKR